VASNWPAKRTKPDWGCRPIASRQGRHAAARLRPLGPGRHVRVDCCSRSCRARPPRPISTAGTWCSIPAVRNA